jgi:hypothetical protein
MEAVAAGVAYGRGSWNEQRRYGHQDYGDGLSSQDTSKYRKALTTMSGSWSRSRSISILSETQISTAIGELRRGNAHLVCGLQLELLKNLLRLRFCSTHCDCSLKSKCRNEAERKRASSELHGKSRCLKERERSKMRRTWSERLL